MSDPKNVFVDTQDKNVYVTDGEDVSREAYIGVVVGVDEERDEVDVFLDLE